MNTAPLGSSGVESPGSYTTGQKAYARSEIRNASVGHFKNIYFYHNLRKPVFNNQLKYQR